MKGLPLAYGKDLQDDKAPTFAASDAMALSLAAMAGMVRDMTVERRSACASATDGGFLDRHRPCRLAGAHARPAVPQRASRDGRVGAPWRRPRIAACRSWRSPTCKGWSRASRMVYSPSLGSTESVASRTSVRRHRAGQGEKTARHGKRMRGSGSNDAGQRLKPFRYKLGDGYSSGADGLDERQQDLAAIVLVAAAAAITGCGRKSGLTPYAWPRWRPARKPLGRADALLRLRLETGRQQAIASSIRFCGRKVRRPAGAAARLRPTYASPVLSIPSFGSPTRRPASFN